MSITVSFTCKRHPDYTGAARQKEDCMGCKQLKDIVDGELVPSPYVQPLRVMTPELTIVTEEDKVDCGYCRMATISPRTYCPEHYPVKEEKETEVSERPTSS